MVLLQLKDPLELFVRSREFPPGSRFLLSRRELLKATNAMRTKLDHAVMDQIYNQNVMIFRISKIPEMTPLKPTIRER